MKLRRGAEIIDPRHLTGELAEIARRLGRNKQRDVRAMPGQRDIARGAAPMLAVIEVGLIERAPLPLIDCSGVAVPELAEFAGFRTGAGDKRNKLLVHAGFAVESDGDPAVFLNAAYRANRAIDDAGAALIAPCRGAGELNAVVFGKRQGTVSGLQHVIATKHSLPCPHLAQRRVNFADIGIRIRKDEAALVRRHCAVALPLLDKSVEGLLLPTAPADPALPRQDRERGQELALVHEIE